jgi:hypothetical protein
MPQFDFFSFFVQIFWFSIFSCFLYLIYLKFFLSNIAKSIKIREKLKNLNSVKDLNFNFLYSTIISYCFNKKV